MKTGKFLIIVLIVALFAGLSSDLYAQQKAKKEKTPKPKAGTVQLFNGKDLKNWSFYLRDATKQPSEVFTVQNGVIHITGEPFGYMRSKEEYSNYVLHVEWRYPVELSNSGIFIHAQMPDTIWPRLVECQLKAGSAGDFVCMNGAQMNEQKDKSVRVVAKQNPSNEKPVGEWNTMEITCRENTIEVVVNGLLQNKATGVNLSKGNICLQSEGKAVEFKNVYLTKLK
jgi:hypothetical protein